MLKRLIAIALLTVSPALAGPVEDKALLDAALHFDFPKVKAALKAGANPNAVSDTRRPMTPLSSMAIGIMAYEGKDADQVGVEMAGTLFKAGARLGPLDRGILFFPISEGKLSLLKLFLDKGASPTAKIEGMTPTEIAVKYGQTAAYDLLLKRGGIPVDGRAAAQLAFIEAAVAAQTGGDFEAMEKALKNGASIDGKDVNGMTALLATARHGTFTYEAAYAIQWLLEHGADPNVEGDSGFSDLEGIPLHVFVFFNSATMKGIEKRPEAKELAIQTMTALLNRGAKVSSMDSRGRTPLHWAAKTDNLVAAEMLISHGARVMARDKAGRTPLDHAESGEMIRFLKKNGARE